MSEQEKKSGGSSAPLVVVEQKSASKHKPIRSAELQEEAVDLRRKQSRGPVVETVAEDSIDSTSQDFKGSDHNLPPEKQKQTMSKKFSSVTSKRGPSMETITLAPVDIETKREAQSSHKQPIPANVEIVASHSDNLLEVKPAGASEKKGETDSITEEITELRTPEAAKKHSEWAEGDNIRSDGEYAEHTEAAFEDIRKTDEMTATISAVKRKEISWENPDYLDKVHVQDMGVRSQVCMLEGKASIGPVFRGIAQNNGPSGICICVPKKGPNLETVFSNPIPSVVNINVSKKHIPIKIKSEINHREKEVKAFMDTKLKPENARSLSFFGEVKMKIENFTSKIINSINI